MGPPVDWKGPLQGVKILDLTRVLAGPFASQILADLGAEVVKIEAPELGDETRSFPPHRGGESHYYVAINRGKKSLVVDLRQPAGKLIIRKLVANADVLVENYRPGVLEGHGLGYESLKAINQRLVYCAITGFGLTGPLRDKPSFDIVTQALSGAMSVNGELGRPPVKLGLPIGDLCGGIFGAIGILAALVERSVTGRGRLVDVSLLDGLMGLLGYLPQLAFFSGVEPRPIGSGHPSIVPYNCYHASDGSILIACLTQGFWSKLATAIGRPDLAERPEFGTVEGRRNHRAEIDNAIAERVARKTVAEWLHILNEWDVPHAPILSITEALTQPHAQARAMLQDIEHPTAGRLRLVGRPIKFPEQPQAPLECPPRLGEHSEAILREELGYSDEEIDELRKKGVVGGPFQADRQGA